MSINEIIQTYGRRDGKDHYRLQNAKYLSQLLDHPICAIFRHLLILEDKKLIELKNLKRSDIENMIRSEDVSN
jgi:hypothetical protein